MMNSFFKISIPTLLFTKIFAAPYIPCDPLPGAISLEGEWIYFSPNSESRYYAVQAEIIETPFLSIQASGTRFANRLDQFYSGYRLGAGYAFAHSPQEFTITWTDLKAQHSSIAINAIPTTLPKTNFVPGTPPNPVSFSRHFHFFSVDSVFVQGLLENSFFDFRAFGGFQYAKLFTKDHYNIIATTEDPSFVNSTQINEFWGIGPEVGFYGEFPLFCGLSFIGNANAALLVGKRRSDNQFTRFSAFPSSDTTVNVFNNQRIWNLVPELNLQLALAYHFSLPCFQDCGTCLKIGYEGAVYFNALSDFIDFASVISLDDYRNVTMHGLVVGLSVDF